MTRCVCNAMAVLLLMLPWVAHAHGYFPPKFGGLMSEGGEISVELVAHADRIVLYVEDHGVPLATQGATGAIATGPTGEPQRVLALVPDGDNRLVGPPVTLAPGQRLVARAELADGNVVFARFRVPMPGERPIAIPAADLPAFARPFTVPRLQAP